MSCMGCMWIRLDVNSGDRADQFEGAFFFFWLQFQKRIWSTGPSYSMSLVSVVENEMGSSRMRKNVKSSNMARCISRVSGQFLGLLLLLLFYSICFLSFLVSRASNPRVPIMLSPFRLWSSD